jgi:capsular exopolysaccharide synthesis family protein
MKEVTAIGGGRALAHGAGPGATLVPHLSEVTAVRWRPDPAEASFSDAAAQIWRFLGKHLGIIAGILGGALALGAALTLLTPPAYTARATLQIDRQAEKVVNAEDQTPIDNLGEEFFQTQYGLLRSRTLAERVADSLALAQDDAFRDLMSGKPRGYVWPRGAGADRRSMVVSLLQRGVSVSPVRASRLVGVNFKSPDPALSARIANSFAENFISAAIDRRYESSSYARDFLEQRLAQVKAKLEESERDLVAYAARQQIIQLPNAGQPGASDNGPSLAAANLEAFNTALASAKTERIRAEQKWREAQAASSGVGIADILQSPTYQALSQEHAKVSAEYQDKLRIFKPDYPDMLQLKARLDESARQMAGEATNIRDALRTQYEAALANEKALTGQVDTLKSSVLDLRGRSIRYTILQREVDTNRSLYDGLLQRYKEVEVAGGVSANNISIIDRAEPPRTPSQPRPVINLGLAGVAGLTLALGVAYLRESLDQTIRTPADFEATPDLPLLGTAPILKRGTTPKQTLADGRSPLAEAFQTVRSALQFSTPDGFPKTVLVTSPWPGTGKTTTAFAVAQYVARLSFRVLLIEADLRNPNLAPLVGATQGAGLTSILTGAATLQDTVQPTNIANLFVVTSGPAAPSPAELLGGSRLPLLIAEASAHFDMVVFDGPPIMNLADAPIIGAAVEGSILVVEAGRTTHRQVKEAMRRMSMAGARVLGAVLNKARRGSDGDGYGYGYGYGYDGEKAADAQALPVLRLARRLLPRLS